jgi:hypothetical protein
MQEWRRRVASFFFVEDSDRWLTLLRIGLGVEILIYTWSLHHDWVHLFAADGEGLISRDLAEALLTSEGKFVPRLSWLVSIGAMFGLAEDSMLSLLWALLFVAGCCLLIGFFSRGAAVMAWFLHLSAAKSFGFLAYGFDNFMTIGLFYLMLSPLPDGYAIDARIWKHPHNAVFLGFSRRIAQLHLSLIYFFGGLAKCVGGGWWTGLSLWRALTRPPFDVLPTDLLIHWRAILPVAGIAVCLLELGYPFLIWPMRTRFVCLIAVIGLHLGIALAMGMYLFSSILIILNVALFAPGSLACDPRIRKGAISLQQRAAKT